MASGMKAGVIAALVVLLIVPAAASTFTDADRQQAQWLATQAQAIFERHFRDYPKWDFRQVRAHYVEANGKRSYFLCGLVLVKGSSEKDWEPFVVVQTPSGPELHFTGHTFPNPVLDHCISTPSVIDDQMEYSRTLRSGNNHAARTPSRAKEALH